MTNDYQEFSEQYFTDTVAESLAKQAEIEMADTTDFDTFLTNYFA